MDLSKVLVELSDDIVENLKKVLEEAHDVRWRLQPPEIHEGPVELHQRLLETRRAQDRLEAMLAQLGRLHARASLAVQDRKAVLDDAEANADLPRAEEYSTAKERNARLMLATVDERIALRQTERREKEIYEVYDYVRTLHRGIDGARRDLDLRVRLISLQSSLER